MDYYDRAAEDCAHKGESVDKLQFVEKWVDAALHDSCVFEVYVEDDAHASHGQHVDCMCNLGHGAFDWFMQFDKIADEYREWLEIAAEKAWEDEQC
jgi:hypothetical protein